MAAPKTPLDNAEKAPSCFELLLREILLKATATRVLQQCSLPFS
jgi:hypothetical protein